MSSEAAKQFIATGPLVESGQFAEAEKALNTLSATDRDFYGSASIQQTAGLLSYRLQNYDAALKHFAAAGSTSPEGDAEHPELLSKSLAASVLLAQGKIRNQPFLASVEDKLGLNTTAPRDGDRRQDVVRRRRRWSDRRRPAACADLR